MNYDVLLCPEKQSFFHLQLGSVVQTDPTTAVGLIALEQPPASRTLTICFLHNGEDALSGITARCVVRAGAFTDIEVIDANSHLIRERCRRCRCTARIRCVHCLPTFIEHGIARVAVRTFLGKLQVMECTFLGLRIIPSLADAVPHSCAAHDSKLRKRRTTSQTEGKLPAPRYST